MNAELIFYLANRTGACESSLRKAAGRLGVELQAVAMATKEGELRFALKQAVDHSNLVFVIGGREAPQGRDIVSVLRRALTSSEIKREEGPGWLLLQSGRQTILSLPDDPEEITRLLEERILYTLSARYSLRLRPKPTLIPPQEWKLPLDERPGPEEPNAEDASLLPLKRQRRVPLWVWILLGLVLTAGVIAGILWLFGRL